MTRGRSPSRSAFAARATPTGSFQSPSHASFSFNNPYGSCPVCTGFGATLEYDPTLIVPEEGASLSQGAVDPWAKPRYDRERDLLRRFALAEGVSWHAPWRQLPEEFRRAVLHGSDGFQGVLDFLVSRETKAVQALYPGLSAPVSAPHALPGLRGNAPATGGALDTGRRAQHRTACRDVDCRSSQMARRFGASPHGASHCRRPSGRTCGAASLSDRCRAGIPHALSPHAHAFGGRGATHCAWPTPSVRAWSIPSMFSMNPRSVFMPPTSMRSLRC